MRDPTAREMLQQVRQTVLEALENQDVSFDRVVEAVKPPRAPGTAPGVPGDVRVPAARAKRRPSSTSATSSSATPTSRPERPSSTSRSLPPNRATGWRRSSNTGPTSSTRETMHRMLGHYGQLLESIARDPGPAGLGARVPHRTRSGSCCSSAGRVSELALDQRPRVLAQIADRAESAPDAVAVVVRRAHADLSVSSRANRTRSRGSSSGSAPAEAGRSRISWTARPRRSPRSSES